MIAVRRGGIRYGVPTIRLPIAFLDQLSGGRRRFDYLYPRAHVEWVDPVGRKYVPRHKRKVDR